jgi:hypothetical protein
VSVTPPKPKDVLSEAAARLSKAAPNTWVDFLAALNGYTRERMDACVQAPADKILVTQGKAQQCGELLTLLTNANKP